MHTPRYLIDARCLSEPHPTGVTEVARQLISHLRTLWPAPTELRAEQVFSNTLGNISYLAHARTMEDAAHVDEDDNVTIFIPNTNFVHTRADTRRIQVVHDISFVHAPQWYAPKVRCWHALARAAAQLKEAARIIAVSEWTARDVIETLGVDPARVHVVNPATPSALTGAAPHLPFSDEPFFLFLGTQERRKNIHGIIEAFRLLSKNPAFAQHHLVIAGSRGYDAPHEKNFAPRTHALSYISAAEKWWLLRHARALVYPSFFEGFGLPPLEAASVGCPAIISDCTAPPHTMKDAAVQVSPFDVKQIALAMEVVTHDERLRTHLIHKGFERARWYNEERQRTQLINALARV